MATQSKHGGAAVRFPPPLVFLLLIGIGAALQRFVWPVALHLPVWLCAVLGGVLMLAGLGLVLLAASWFRRTGQDPAPWKPSPELVVQGLYRFTRNPMYAGMTLVQLGVGSAAANVWIAALAPVSLLLVHFIAVRPEEAYLEEKFGDSYRRYKESVRRYL